MDRPIEKSAAGSPPKGSPPKEALAKQPSRPHTMAKRSLWGDASEAERKTDKAHPSEEEMPQRGSSRKPKQMESLLQALMGDKKIPRPKAARNPTAT